MSKHPIAVLPFVISVTLCCGSIPACVRGPGGHPIAAAPNAVGASPFATCTFLYRDGQGGPEEEATLTVAGGHEGTDRKASTTLGDFRMLVTEGSQPPHVAGSVTVWVGAKTAPENEWIDHTVYQLDLQDRSLGQEIDGGHGFTGLHHVRHPQSGTELQWLCMKAGPTE